MVNERLNHVRLTDMNQKFTKTKLSVVLTEPLIRALWATQIITTADWVGIQGLASIHTRIDPGGAKDDATNMFVYTCKGGWIDVGHVISSALTYKIIRQALTGNGLFRSAASFLMGKGKLLKFQMISDQLSLRLKWATDENGLKGDLNFWAGYFAMRSTVWLEEKQNETKERSKPENYDGNATSAFTLEDLPSNYLGIQLGERMERKSFIGGVVKTFRREINALLNQLDYVDFGNELPKRKECSSTEPMDIVKQDATYYAKQVLLGRALNSKGVSQDPRSPYNFTIYPKKTLHHSCLCDRNDKPINIKHR